MHINLRTAAAQTSATTHQGQAERSSSSSAAAATPKRAMNRRATTSHDKATATASAARLRRKTFRDLLGLQSEERGELRQHAAGSGSGAGAGAKPSFFRRRTMDITEEARRPPSPPPLDKQRRRSADMVSSDVLSEHVPDAIDVAMDASTTSRVSDVTNITYSEEKAGMLREEFVRRVQQVGRRRLSVEERLDLVNEIQAEVGEKFKEMQEKEEKKEEEKEKEERKEDTKRPSPERKKNDLLKRFRAMKEEGARRDNNQKTPVLRGRGRSFHVVESVKAKDIERNASVGGMLKCFSSNGSLASTGTARVDNSRATPSARQSSHEDAPCSAADPDAEDPPEQQEANREENSTPPKTAEDDLSPPHPHRDDVPDSDCIQQLIDLKMLVAEQQAAIDTLSSRLHNVELANRRLQSRVDESERTADEEADVVREANVREVHLMNENAQLRYRLALLGGGGTGSAAAQQKDMPRFSINTVSTHASTDVDTVAYTL